MSYNAKGVGTQDMAAMFDNITKSLSFLAARVELLEGGPDQKKTDRPAQGQSKEAGPPTQIKSNNDDFAAVVKDMYRMVLLDHYTDNWTQLLKSLSELERPEVRRCCHELSTDHKDSDIMRTVDCGV